MTYQSIQMSLGYEFRDPELLKLALTHRSLRETNSEGRRLDNERLEFLGDAVLDLSISQLLMETFKDAKEGILSKKRAGLVNETTLSFIAKELGIESDIRLGKGEVASGGATKPRILSSTFEAIVGAIFLDSNFDTVNDVICSIYKPHLEEFSNLGIFNKDYKTQLQEMTQKAYGVLPKYIVESEEGPEHEKLFKVSVTIEDKLLAQGQGKSKKQAEQDAAEQALKELEEDV